MSLKKVLVTGATGQIGNAVFKRLKEQPEKYDVYALDRSATFSARVPGNWVLNIPKERLHLCDLTNMEGLQSAVQGMDVVVHLAADPSPNTWESVLNNNIIGAYNAFEACRQAGVGRIIAASSITVSNGYPEEEPYKAILEKRYEDVPAGFPNSGRAHLRAPASLPVCGTLSRSLSFASTPMNRSDLTYSTVCLTMTGDG